MLLEFPPKFHQVSIRCNNFILLAVCDVRPPRKLIYLLLEIVPSESIVLDSGFSFSIHL